jgi:hypothetical protein
MSDSIIDATLIQTTPLFEKELRSLKYYCMRSYKDLMFNIGADEIRKVKRGINKIDIFTDSTFKAIYGQIRVVYERQGKYIVLLCIEPENLLLAGYGRLLEICKGIPIMSEKDRFKVETLKKLEALK